MSSKLVEAAARAILDFDAGDESLLTACEVPEWYAGDLAKIAILAFFEAALEDDKTIDALALAASQNSARAALRALIQQVKS